MSLSESHMLTPGSIKCNQEKQGSMGHGAILT